MKPQLIEIGTIVNTHGIHGEVRVVPRRCSVDFLLACKTFWLDGAPVSPSAGRRHKSFALLCFPGVADMDAALALKGKKLSIRPDETRLPDGKYFDDELIGMEVFDDATGAPLGTLTDVLAYPAHDIYEVRGARTYLVPAVPAFIKYADPAQNAMRIAVLEGLAVDET